MQIELNAKKREAQGTGASRRLRRAGNVPGIIYGGGKDAATIELNHKELFLQFRHEAFHASILNLNVDGKAEQVLLRDYQMHPVRIWYLNRRHRPGQRRTVVGLDDGARVERPRFPERLAL